MYQRRDRSGGPPLDKRQAILHRIDLRSGPTTLTEKDLD